MPRHACSLPPPTEATTIQGWLGNRSITSTAVYTAPASGRFQDFWRDQGRRYEIARHDPPRRRLCQASLHRASCSRIKTNQISGSDFRVGRRRFCVGMACLLPLQTISASHDYTAQYTSRQSPPDGASRRWGDDTLLSATQRSYLCRIIEFKRVPVGFVSPPSRSRLQDHGRAGWIHEITHGG
jgi:hypothetical protein